MLIQSVPLKSSFNFPLNISTEDIFNSPCIEFSGTHASLSPVLIDPTSQPYDLSFPNDSQFSFPNMGFIENDICNLNDYGSQILSPGDDSIPVFNDPDPDEDIDNPSTFMANAIATSIDKWGLEATVEAILNDKKINDGIIRKHNADTHKELKDSLTSFQLWRDKKKKDRYWNSFDEK